MVGKGSYGKVFKAKCRNTGRKVAIKYIDFRNNETNLVLSICREFKISMFLSTRTQNLFTPKLLDVFYPKEANPEKIDSIKGIYLVSEYMRYTLDDALSHSS